MQVREGNVRTQPRRGSGPLFDIGIYCVNAARYLFRSEPIDVTATRLSGSDPRFASIDEAYSVAMRFPRERIAQFTCSFGAHDRSTYQVIGTEGYLTLDNAYDYDTEMKLVVEGKGIRRERTFTKRDQIAAEIEYFARCVRDDLEPEPSGWEGLADIRIVQAIQSSARFGRAVSVEPIPRPRRPELAQAIAMPAHAQAPLVDVVASSK
jgi:glucose-fructose oxidoreductase